MTNGEIMIHAQSDSESTPDPGPTLHSLAGAIRFRLETIRRFGWEPPLGALAPVGQILPVAPEVPAGAGSGSEGPGSEGPEDERERRRALLEAIDERVRQCRDCPLCEGRTNTVFGVGDPCARLMFVGEGPGYDEDRLGEPFVGKAGQLLDKMIAAMGLDRSRVYIANIVKCRPPGNRTPEAGEMATCFPYLREQIEIVQPEVLCTLGNTPARALLQTTTPISRLRGRFQEYAGVPVMPTFHPAYLLRNEGAKAKVWDDLKMIMGRLKLPLPAARRRKP